MGLAAFCARLLRERLQQLGFDLDLTRAALQLRALEQEDIFHIGKLIQLFKPEPVKILVVHISNEDELMIKNLLEWFKQSLQEKIKYEHLDFSVIFSEDRLKGLQTAIKRNSADLVVILERAPRPERSGIFYKDLVQELQSKIKIPVLSYNETN